MGEPRDEADVAEAVAGARGPLSVRGGGTRGAAAAGEVLTVAGLSGVSLYEPGALTLVVQAGTPVAEVDRVLAADGQALPFEPMDHRALLGTAGAPTIGGLVAANVSGPRRVRVGACRDFLLGVRFVDGTGTVVKNGGRVMKNVTGYDLVKLMAGSRGTLGVLTEVALKVLPAPEAVASLEVAGLDPAGGVAALSACLSSPFEVTGAAHLPGPSPRTLVRIEGFKASVAYRAGKLAALLEPHGPATVTCETATVAAHWAEVRDVTPLAGRDGAVWRISVKPSDGPDVLARLGQPPAVMDWGGGLVWALVPDGHDVRAALKGLAGHATRMRGGGPGPALPPEPAPMGQVAAALRRRFDPRGILNPGMMDA